ncbi:MFS transporter [Neisseria montereyensis]|uniref:MFS transporter n=1 Tax=Neisseria montereyensis TaxID=2973938 RepID=A0ABT2F9C8_9NEIS|nr:MFS transporter [Neisseria montereyensis]MCS4532705.1 MFS transporter [Neisseria montereyensis]
MGNRWLKFLLLYLGGVSVSLSQLKIVPLQNEFSLTTGWSLTEISWLLSIFTVSGIFLSIFGGVLITKYGAKKILNLVMICTILGNLLGYFATSYLLLLLSRVIEGIAFSMIIMVGIVFINEWFRDNHRGMATGIWGTFAAAGTLIAMNLFLPLANASGLKAPWLLVAIIAAVLMLFYQIAIKEPDEEKKLDNVADTKLLKQAMSNKKIWLLAFAQGCMSFVLFSFINIYPLIYTQQYNISESMANQYAGYFGLFGIPFGALAGYLIDKTKKDRLVTIGSFLLMTLSTLFAIMLNSTGAIFLQLFLLAASTGLSSACIMIIAPNFLENKKLIGISISLINFVYYIGIFIGTPISTMIASWSGNWIPSILTLTFVNMIGLVIVAFLKYDHKQNMVKTI